MFYDKRKDFYMEFRDLRYFIDLVESESYHATAQKNQVTQPAISAIVKRLEGPAGLYKIKPGSPGHHASGTSLI